MKLLLCFPLVLMCCFSFKGAHLSEEEIKLAEDKFEESFNLASMGMFNLLENDVCIIFSCFLQKTYNYYIKNILSCNWMRFITVIYFFVFLAVCDILLALLKCSVYRLNKFPNWRHLQNLYTIITTNVLPSFRVPQKG